MLTQFKLAGSTRLPWDLRLGASLQLYQRILSTNGATWQTDAVERFESAGMDRHKALAEMLRLYAKHMHSNEPVHTWPLP